MRIAAQTLPESNDPSPSSPVQLYDSAGQVIPSALATRISDSSARGIAREVLHLVRAGELAAGVRLPPVRALAASLHVGPTMVAEAWTLLKSSGMVRTHGRSGTFIEDHDCLPGRRFLGVSTRPGVVLDLTRAVPDQDWLPDLGGALERAHSGIDWRRYSVDLVDPMLVPPLTRSWPFEPDDLTVTHSGLEAVTMAIDVAIGPGDRVLIEESCAPELRDIVELLRAVAIPIRCDDEGPLPDSVRAELDRHNPRLLILQPRMANPTGHALTIDRCRALADLLHGRPITIVEHDADPALSIEPAISLGTLLPDQTALARGWNRSHGPQLRIGALGGAQQLVGRVRARQNLTATSPSMINQRALAIMLADPHARKIVRAAARTYHLRRRTLVAAVANRGFLVPGSGGLSAWIRVPSPTRALDELEKRRIGVSPGRPFTTDGLAKHYIRIATTVPHELHDEIADALVRASM